MGSHAGQRRAITSVNITQFGNQFPGTTSLFPLDKSLHFPLDKHERDHPNLQQYKSSPLFHLSKIVDISPSFLIYTFSNIFSREKENSVLPQELLCYPSSMSFSPSGHDKGWFMLIQIQNWHRQSYKRTEFNLSFVVPLFYPFGSISLTPCFSPKSQCIILCF